MISRLLMAVALWAAPAAAKTFPSKVLPGVTIDDRGRPAEGVRLEAGLARLQRSPTARRREARRRTLGEVLLTFGMLNTTATAKPATLGLTECGDGACRVQIDEVLIATGPFIEILAHELYGHSIIDREGPALGLDMNHTIEDEGFSEAIGAVAAMETGAEVMGAQWFEALVLSTSAYAAAVLFTDDMANVRFNLVEAPDPRAAIAARIKELARRRLSLTQRRREALVWRWQIEHFEKVHRVDPRTFADRRAELDDLADEIAGHAEQLDAAEPNLKDLAAFLDTPDGRAFAGRVAESTRNPYLLALNREFAALGRRLAELRAKLPDEPAGAAPAVKPASWDDLRTMGTRDRDENPAHWTRAPTIRDEALPWLAPSRQAWRAGVVTWGQESR